MFFVSGCFVCFDSLFVCFKWFFLVSGINFYIYKDVAIGTFYTWLGLGQWIIISIYLEQDLDQMGASPYTLITIISISYKFLTNCYIQVAVAIMIID